MTLEESQLEEVAEDETLAPHDSRHVSFAELSQAEASKLSSRSQQLGFDDSSTADFWKEHDNWKERVVKDKLFENVRISEPETAPRTLVSLNPPVYYKVSVSDFDGYVRRRYSDFEWIQRE